MEAKDETKERLEILSDMIRSVYLPLMESKTDSKIAMDKFVKSVKTSMQQAYGNITIYVPNLPEASIDELCANKPLIEELMVTIVSIDLNSIQNYRKAMQVVFVWLFQFLFMLVLLFVTKFKFVIFEFNLIEPVFNSNL